VPKPLTFGEMLRGLREERAMSQQSLADAAGISQIAISFYELGKREPGWNAVVKMCKALGVECTVFDGLFADAGGDMQSKRTKPKGKK
jgi:transcriptional regulator with XRE-family HTH domain